MFFVVGETHVKMSRQRSWMERKEILNKWKKFLVCFWTLYSFLFSDFEIWPFLGCESQKTEFSSIFYLFFWSSKLKIDPWNPANYQKMRLIFLHRMTNFWTRSRTSIFCVWNPIFLPTARYLIEPDFGSQKFWKKAIFSECKNGFLSHPRPSRSLSKNKCDLVGFALKEHFFKKWNLCTCIRTLLALSVNFFICMALFFHSFPFFDPSLLYFIFPHTFSLVRKQSRKKHKIARKKVKLHKSF